MAIRVRERPKSVWIQILTGLSGGNTTVASVYMEAASVAAKVAVAADSAGRALSTDEISAIETAIRRVNPDFTLFIYEGWLNRKGGSTDAQQKK